MSVRSLIRGVIVSTHLYLAYGDSSSGNQSTESLLSSFVGVVYRTCVSCAGG